MCIRDRLKIEQSILFVIIAFNASLVLQSTFMMRLVWSVVFIYSFNLFLLSQKQSMPSSGFGTIGRRCICLGYPRPRWGTSVSQTPSSFMSPNNPARSTPCILHYTGSVHLAGHVYRYFLLELTSRYKKPPCYMQLQNRQIECSVVQPSPMWGSLSRWGPMW